MDLATLLRGWNNGLAILHRAHWEAARQYDGRNFKLGLATTLTATVSGAGALATLEQAVGESVAYRVGIGLLGITAAALSAIQTYHRSAETAEKHKVAATKYGALRRELEQYRFEYETSQASQTPGALTSFRERWAAVDSEAPPVPEKIYERVQAELRRRNTVEPPQPMGTPAPHSPAG